MSAIKYQTNFANKIIFREPKKNNLSLLISTPFFSQFFSFFFFVLYLIIVYNPVENDTFEEAKWKNDGKSFRKTLASWKAIKVFWVKAARKDKSVKGWENGKLYKWEMRGEGARGINKFMDVYRGKWGPLRFLGV